MNRERIRNGNATRSRMNPDLAYARGAGSREQGGEEQGCMSSMLLDSLGRIERPIMDGGYRREIGGGC